MSDVGGAIGGDGRTALRDAIGLFVSLRVVFGLFALYLWGTAQLPGPCHFELARNGWQTIPPLADSGPAFPLVGVWQRWDACWYTKIATYGYEAGEHSTNFWPLFPLLTGIVGRVLLSSMALGGLLVSGVAYVAAMTGLRRLVSVDFDDDTAATDRHRDLDLPDRVLLLRPVHRIALPRPLRLVDPRCSTATLAAGRARRPARRPDAGSRASSSSSRSAGRRSRPGAGRTDRVG